MLYLCVDNITLPNSNPFTNLTSNPLTFWFGWLKLLVFTDMFWYYILVKGTVFVQFLAASDEEATTKINQVYGLPMVFNVNTTNPNSTWYKA